MHVLRRQRHTTHQVGYFQAQAPQTRPRHQHVRRRLGSAVSGGPIGKQAAQLGGYAAVGLRPLCRTLL